ncbi:MAG: TonB-dependent receptor domain-containing protein [Gammaproteobacteria bacterium]
MTKNMAFAYYMAIHSMKCLGRKSMDALLPALLGVALCVMLTASPVAIAEPAQLSSESELQVQPARLSPVGDVETLVSIYTGVSHDELNIFNRTELDRAALDLLPTTPAGQYLDWFGQEAYSAFSAVSLRNLGGGRTLVLVDGQRLDTVPLVRGDWFDQAASVADYAGSSLHGIEIIDGATSALYGSGAVAGAVNLVTRSDYRGFSYRWIDADTQGADTQSLASFILGVGGSKTNVVVSLTDSTSPELKLEDRAWGRAFQQQMPEYSQSRNNGSIGLFNFSAGQMVDIYPGDPETLGDSGLISSCTSQDVDVIDDAESTYEGATYSVQVLCGDEEVVYTGLTSLATGASTLDPTCANPEESDSLCRRSYVGSQYLAQQEERESMWVSVTHTFNEGGEGRFQYGRSRRSNPHVRQVLQRQALDEVFRSWQPQVSNYAVPSVLSLIIGDGTLGNIAIPGLTFDALTAPDVSYFLTNRAAGIEFGDDSGLTQAQQDDLNAQLQDLQDAAADSAVMSYTADNLLTAVDWTSALYGLAQSEGALDFDGEVFSGPSLSTNVFGATNYKSDRYSWEMDGQFGLSGIYYNSAVIYDEAQSEVIQRDLLVQHVSRLLDGYGGGFCPYSAAVENDRLIAEGEDPLSVYRAGEAGCFYWLPLAGGFLATSGLVFPAALELSVLPWLFGTHRVQREQTQFLANLVLSGVNSRGSLSWSAGWEYRREDFDLRPLGYADASVYGDLASPLLEDEEHPFDASADISPLGPFIHLSAVNGHSTDRAIWSGFFDIKWQLHQLQLQLSGRTDIPDDSDMQFAPLVAVSWLPSAGLKLFAQWSTSFKLPPLNQQADLDRETFYLDATKSQDYGLDLNYIPIVIQPASSDLEVETSEDLSLGLRLQSKSTVFWLKYWQQSVQGAIIRESPLLLAEALANTDTSSAEYQAVAARLVCASTSAGCVGTGLAEGFNIQYQNGPDIDAAGLNMHFGLEIPAGRGAVFLSLDMDWLHQYQVDDLLLDGQVLSASFDATGQYNAGYAFGSLPEAQVVGQLGWQHSWHQIRLLSRYTSSYTDQLFDTEVGSWNSYDLSYNYQVPSERLVLGVGVSNVTDTAPPMVRTPLGYDSKQHDPFGRVVRFSVQIKYE